jgi:Aminoglycoside-2''-adenylyltransferase
MNASARQQLAAIGTLHERFARQGIEYWLFGGWAVDFYVGRVTRTHDDIDLAIWARDLHGADRVLRDAGWVHQPQPGEDGYTEYGNGAIHLDLALLARDACGVVYTPLQEGRGEWSQGAFGQDERELEGACARLVSVASLRADKAGRREDAPAAMKDRVDVETLDLAQNDG